MDGGESRGGVGRRGEERGGEGDNVWGRARGGGGGCRVRGVLCWEELLLFSLQKTFFKLSTYKVTEFWELSIEAATSTHTCTIIPTQTPSYLHRHYHTYTDTIIPTQTPSYLHRHTSTTHTQFYTRTYTCTDLLLYTFTYICTYTFIHLNLYIYTSTHSYTPLPTLTHLYLLLLTYAYTLCQSAWFAQSKISAVLGPIYDSSW